MKLKGKLNLLFSSILVFVILVLFTIYQIGLDKMYSIGKEESINSTNSAKITLSNLIEYAYSDLDLIGKIIEFKGENEGFRFGSTLISNKDIYTLLFFGRDTDGLFRSMPARRMEEGFDPRDEKWYEKTVNMEDLTISPPYYDPVRKLYTFTISKPIYKYGKFYGVLGLNINMNTLNAMLNQNSIGESGYLMLLSKEMGTIMSHPNEEFIGKSYNEIAEEFSFFSSSDYESGFLDYSVDSDEKFLYYEYLPGVEWILTGGTSYRDFYNRYDLLRLIFIASGFILFITIMLTKRYFNTNIVSLILEISEKFKLLAQGDFTSPLQCRKGAKDEIGELMESYESFRISIAEMLVDIKVKIKSSIDTNSKIVEEVNMLKDKTVEELIGAIDNSLDDIMQQSASTEESLASIEQVSAGAESMLNNVHETLSASKQSREDIQGGVVKVEEMNKQIFKIDEQVKNANVQIEKLLNFSSNIGNITLAISELSEQTNLLALNAAIESARAGEAGRGFAVVSQEIKKLAERTNVETNKIDEIVKNIHSEVQNVKNANYQIKDAVDYGLELNQVVTNNIDKIRLNIVENDNKINEINTIVTEQQIATQEISHSINHITSMSNDIEVKSTNNLDLTKTLINKLDTNIVTINRVSVELDDLNQSFKRFNLEDELEDISI